MPIEITNQQLSALESGEFECGGRYIRVLGKALDIREVIISLANECTEAYESSNRRPNGRAFSVVKTPPAIDCPHCKSRWIDHTKIEREACESILGWSSSEEDMKI